MPPLLFVILLLIAAFSCVAESNPPENRLTATILSNVAQVVSAASESPDRTYSIRLDASVLYSDPAGRRVVLADGSGAAQFEADWIGSFPKAGQHVRVSGYGSVETVGPVFRLGRMSPVINNNDMRAATEKAGSIYLSAGRHPIRVKYFHVNGKAELTFTYSGPGITRQRIPDSALFQRGSSASGLVCRYYEGVWQTLPDFESLGALKTGTVSNFDFSFARNKDEVGLGFGMTFDGEIEITRAGRYTFYLRSRDGSQLFVDDPSIRIQMVGTNDFPAPRSVTIGQTLDKSDRFWAEVEGDVTFVAARPAGGWDVELNEGDAALPVELANEIVSPKELLNSRVVLRGYCETAHDRYQRIIPGRLLVPNRAQIVQVETLAEQKAATTNGISDVLHSPATIHSVRRLKPEIQQRGIPFKIHGVVTCVQRDHNAFVIQDSTSGIYLLNSPDTEIDLPESSEFVEVEGVTTRGAGIARRIQRLGLGTLPDPIHPSWAQLLNGSQDSKYVEIRGVIDTFFHRANGWSHVDLRTADGTLRIDVRRAGIRPGPLESYQGAVVRLRGCLFHALDIATQRVKVGQIRMSDMDVFLDEPADVDFFSLPQRPVSSLSRFDPEADVFRRVKTGGQIIFVQGEDYYMMDGEEGVRFTLKVSPGLKAGDIVEVVGFPELRGTVLFLRGAVARKVGHDKLPQPKRLTPDELVLAANDSTLVRVDAVLANVKSGRTNMVFEMQAAQRRFLARLSSSEELKLDLPVGSRLELTGIYSGQAGYSPLGNDFIAADLLLRTPEDIHVLATPPWWTLKRLGIVVTALALLIGAMILWVHQLRKKVEERTHEVQALNRNLEQRATALEMANKEMESFSYSVSHDLRAPLRSIDGFSRALMEDYYDKLQDSGKEDLQTIRNASQRMGQLIDDMLTLAKVSRSEIRPMPMDLSALAEAIAQDLKRTDPGRQVEFRIAPGLTANADPQLMRVVLENLLGNAWKFTSRKSGASIEFNSSSKNGQSSYFVRDNGVGFDMEYAHKLFGAFQRLHTSEEFPGTGIGLATVQRIIHRQGGRVWAESVMDQGATFYFTLPNSENCHEK